MCKNVATCIMWQSATLWNTRMSKSLRLSDELLRGATEAGKALSRSAAQQVEHWARLGRALEMRGLTIDAATALLSGPEFTSPEELWAHKRRLQRRDAALVRDGTVRARDLHLVPQAIARNAKIVGAPY